MTGRSQIAEHQTDILILGSGGAGLFAALHARQSAPGANITLATKGLIGKSGCTRMVQGGYNVALGADDSIDRHFMDTIEGGKWLPNQQMAMRLCEEAVTRIHELENELGCFFDRNADGTIHQKAFAGQTADRTVHKGDLTGIEIVSRLMETVLAQNISHLNEHRAIALIPSKDGGTLAGALFINIRTGEFHLIRARATLLATGGGPTMYRYHTPSGDKSMDGLAMALSLGLPLRDMEMVQFHPTGLLAGPGTRMTGTVLEEGLRGAGGHLLTHEGHRFMEGYDPKGERATRDVVSRAIYSEMRKSNDPERIGVFISMSHLGPETVRSKFRGMVQRCADCGFDLAGGKVEVVPTAHYHMGGVVVDVNTRSALPGLYVAGEDAGGAHGANRLGGNGVANSTVFGGIAGDVMAADLANLALAQPDPAAIDAAQSRALAPFAGKPAPVHHLREELQNIMWEDVGVMRTEAGLKRAEARLAEVSAELAATGIADSPRPFNLTWHDRLNLENLTTISKAITAAAQARTNSRGAHYREDHPGTGDLAASAFTEVQHTGAGFDTRLTPVDFSIVRPGESLLAGHPETEQEAG